MRCRVNGIPGIIDFVRNGLMVLREGFWRRPASGHSRQWDGRRDEVCLFLHVLSFYYEILFIVNVVKILHFTAGCLAVRPRRGAAWIFIGDEWDEHR
jgi:hypothetical protein